MTSNAAEKYVARRERNLNYFRTHYPDIYMFFAEYKLQRYQLNILPDTDEVDLLGASGSLYDEAGKSFARAEVQTFRSVFSKGCSLQTIAPLSERGLHHPRFMHQRLRQLVHPFQDEIRAFEHYDLEFFPMLVFLGIGLGYQVEELLAQEKIQNVIVAESDPDFFAASLYTVDWARICERFRSDRGQTIHFIVGMTGKAEDIFPELWNTLIQHCPVYPTGTMFYTHRGSAAYNWVADRINREMHVFLASWGHYDDEVRQLNNALHTFHLNIPLLPEAPSLQFDMPVFLVGNGPSLDARIEQLKECRDKALIVSCGTALRSLLSYGVEPDFHVELESDFITFRVLDAIDHDKLQKLRLIAPSHVCPLIFDLFGESRIYFKEENCVAQFFSDGRHIVQKGVPTCVNAALAVFVKLGFHNLFLYGMDFGYRDTDYHHSRASIYHAEDSEKEEKKLKGIADFRPNHEILTDGWDGGQIRTTNIFFSTKRMVERLTEQLVRENNQQLVFCCSDGAQIENTQWLSNEQMRSLFADVPEVSKDAVVATLFAPDAQRLDLNTVEQRVSEADQQLKRACRRIGQMLKQTRTDSLWELSCLCSRINHFMESDVGSKSHGLYYLIRGTMRHFTFIGLSYAWAIGEPERRKLFISKWRQALTLAVDDLPSHFERVTQKTYQLQTDPWVRQGINSKEHFEAPVSANG